MTNTEFRPTLNHVAVSMDPAVLDEKGRAEILDFYGEVFGWTEGDNSMESGNPLILYTGPFAQFVYLLPGEPYMVMEFLAGEDLAYHARASSLVSIGDAIEYITQACDAIAEAHELGIVHRDLKPANLFLTRRHDGAPMVKVLDFGISKVVGDAGGDVALVHSVRRLERSRGRIEAGHESRQDLPPGRLRSGVDLASQPSRDELGTHQAPGLLAQAIDLAAVGTGERRADQQLRRDLRTQPVGRDDAVDEGDERSRIVLGEVADVAVGKPELRSGQEFGDVERLRETRVTDAVEEIHTDARVRVRREVRRQTRMQDPEEAGHSRQEARRGGIDRAFEGPEVLLQRGSEVRARSGGLSQPVCDQPAGDVLDLRIAELGEDRVDRIPDVDITLIGFRARERDALREHGQPAGALRRNGAQRLQ